MREAQSVIHLLQEGNRRYASGLPADWAADGEPPHRPLAVVVGCSDARVPAEAVFGQPPGALFVVRVAGNVLEPAALTSVRFAVETLGAGLVVVLGHTGCGAVRAALDHGSDPGLAAVTDPIRRRLAGCGLHDVTDERSAIASNVRQTASEIIEHLQKTLPAGLARPMVKSGVCDVGTGIVEWLD